jgi:hypothetical protein
MSSFSNQRRFLEGKFQCLCVSTYPRIACYCGVADDSFAYFGIKKILALLNLHFRHCVEEPVYDVKATRMNRGRRGYSVQILTYDDNEWFFSLEVGWV